MLGRSLGDADATLIFLSHVIPFGSPRYHSIMGTRDLVYLFREDSNETGSLSVAWFRARTTHTGSRATSLFATEKGCVWQMMPRDRRVPRAQHALDLAAVLVLFPSVFARSLTHTISPDRAAHRSGNTIESVWILFAHPTGRSTTSTWIHTHGRVGFRRTLWCFLGALFVVHELTGLSGTWLTETDTKQQGSKLASRPRAVPQMTSQNQG